MIGEFVARLAGVVAALGLVAYGVADLVSCWRAWRTIRAVERGDHDL